VSIPVPQHHTKPLFVSVVYLSQQPRQVRIGLSLPVDAELKDLRDQLASDTGISEPFMLLTEIDDTGFVRTLSGKKFSILVFFFVILLSVGGVVTN